MQTGSEKNVQPLIQIDPSWCALRSTVWKPRPDKTSIHTALKEFFQPLRSNDTRADFFAVYRKESEEFDRDYAGKYDEDLNTSLIFVSRETSAFEDCALNGGVYTGRSVFGGQLSVHHRRPIQSPTRPERDDRHLYANPHSHHERISFPRCRPTHNRLEWPFHRNRNRAVPALREPCGFPLCGLRGYAGEAMGQPLHSQSRRLRQGEELGTTAETRRDEAMELSSYD